MLYILILAENESTDGDDGVGNGIEYMLYFITCQILLILVMFKLSISHILFYVVDDVYFDRLASILVRDLSLIEGNIL